MNLIRLAAALVLISQLILLISLSNPNASSAIVFAFAGHPILGLGLILTAWSIIRRGRGTADSRG